MNRLTRGIGALVATVAVVGILVVIELISIKYHYTWDLTKNKRHSLSEQSERALAALPRDVTLLAFYIEGRPGRQRAEDLLRQYANASKRVRYELIDPQREVGKTQQYNVTTDETIVVLSGDRRETVSFADEEKLTNAILKVTRTGGRKVYFTTGHGERQINDSSERGLARLRSTLEEGGYATASLNLATAAAVPDDADAVVVAGPRADLLKPEAERLGAYLQRGGHLLVLADPPQAPTPEVAGLVKAYGLELRDAILIEPNLRLALPDPLVAIVEQFGTHPITSGLGKGGFAALMPIARPVIPAEKAPEGVEVTWLARSSETSWATPREALTPGASIGFDARRDLKGPVTVAAAVTFTPKAGGEPAAKTGTPGAASPASQSPAAGTPTAAASPSPGASPAIAAASPSPAASPAAAGGPPAAEAREAPKQQGRLVVIGDSDFASNQWFENPANRELAVGAVSWLASEEAILSIRQREGISAPLFLTPGQSLAGFLLSFVVLPLGAVAAGVAVWVTRRRRHG